MKIRNIYFDLTGFLIVENTLTPEEVAQCNAALDHHIEALRERENSLEPFSATARNTN